MDIRTCSTYLMVPCSISKNPLMIIAHCITNEAQNRFKPVALYPNRFKNVIKKAKPMKIITWISWKSARDKQKLIKSQKIGKSIEKSYGDIWEHKLDFLQTEAFHFLVIILHRIPLMKRIKLRKLLELATVQHIPTSRASSPRMCASFTFFS